MDGVETKMATVKETAQAYEPPQTKNVADLDKVSVDIEVKSDVGKDKDGEDFTYFYIEIDEERYRIAGSVLGGLKEILKKMPHLKHFSVLKSGVGMATRYQVIPYTTPEVEGEA